MAGDERIEESSKSFNDLRQDLRGRPRELSNLLRLAWRLYEQANYEEALKILQNAGRRFANDFEVAYAMGLISKKMGKSADAQNFFREVIRLSEGIADKTRARMLRRFAVGHTNMIENGGWNLMEQVS
ncbi:MAG: tetratricopeptide repeat protein [Chloroflexi bacterium]|nr:tetratricopeptide repeat protein [Chloroflexota bacterium]